MGFLYHLSMFLYGAGLQLASPFVPKAKLWVEGRKNWRDNYSSLLKNLDSPIWMHAASLGEFEQGRPVLEALKKHHPKRSIVLTFFSPSGFEVRKNWEGADLVIYLPLDTKKNALDFVSLLNPSVAIFVKYEFWMNTLGVLKERKVPTVLISGIFRSNHVFMKNYGGWFKRKMKAFTMTFMQNEESVAFAKTLGIPSQLSGDTRFDRVVEIAEKSQRVDPVHQFINGQPAIVAGSSWEPEEQLLGAFSLIRPDVKIVVVPHEIGEAHLKQIEAHFLGRCVRLSKLKDSDSCQVLIVDQIGMLSRIYREATIAVLGGGFGAGIHNTLEAAVYGVPVLFGPKYDKFIEAHELIACGGGFSFATTTDLKEGLIRLLEASEECLQSGKAAKEYVEQKAGATKQIVAYLADNVLV